MTTHIYRITGTGALSRDFGLKDQMQRAGVSVMSNIAEGPERCSQPDFLRFLKIAKASCAELRSQIYIASDVGYLTGDTFAELLSQADEVGRILGGLIRSIERELGPA